MASSWEQVPYNSLHQLHDSQVHPDKQEQKQQTRSLMARQVKRIQHYCKTLTRQRPYDKDSRRPKQDANATNGTNKGGGQKKLVMLATEKKTKDSMQDLTLDSTQWELTSHPEQYSSDLNYNS